MGLPTWLPSGPNTSISVFSLQNIPFGIISLDAKGDQVPRPAVAIQHQALDLKEFASNGGFKHLEENEALTEVFQAQTLNAFAALGQKTHRKVRKYLQQVFTLDTPFPDVLKENEPLKSTALVELSDCTNHLPMAIGDYTDFYAGLNHAYNVGVLFRGPDNALQPNYKHLPVGYHGRASTVVVSETPIRRPNGQTLEDPTAAEKIPTFGPCRKLDMELELGAFFCGDNKIGEPIPIAEAAEHIFGFVLMNDWSARDIQAWEYVPLGPFLAKSFATSISPWIVLPDALEPFLAQGLEPGNRTSLLPYLRESKAENCYDINLEVYLRTKSSPGFDRICTTSSKNLLFSFAQMIAHHSVNGCAMRTGDLLGSGTISGTTPGSQGALLELTKGGKEPITIEKETRTFLEDGDGIIIRGWCGEEGSYVGFGQCSGVIKPAVKFP